MENIGDLWDSIVENFSFGLAGQIGSEEGSACIPWYLAKMFVNWAAIIAGLVLLGFMLYGGYMYMTSAGDPGKVENGQKTIVNSVIGFAIVVLAWSVAGLVMWLFNAQIPTLCRDLPDTSNGACESDSCATGYMCIPRGDGGHDCVPDYSGN